MNYSVVFLIISVVMSVYLANTIAKQKNLDPMFWGILAAVIGPFVIPIVMLVKSQPPK